MDEMKFPYLVEEKENLVQVHSYGRTYTYAVYDNSLTLKYVQKDEWGESITEFLNYDEISAFSAEAQSLIDASGIASYVPPAE